MMDRMQPVFRDVFDDPQLVLRHDLTAAEVESWDSLSHIDLIVAIEHEFRVKFTTSEVAGLRNVGDFAALLERKLAARP